MAARAARDRQRRRSSAPGRARRLALARLSRPPGEPFPRAARGAPAARRVRLQLRGDRRDRRQERGQRAPARDPRAPPCRGGQAAFRGVTRATRGAGATLLRGRPRGRRERARDDAREGCRPPRRRWRQGASHRPRSPRQPPRGPNARRVDAGGHPHPRRGNPRGGKSTVSRAP